MITFGTPACGRAAAIPFNLLSSLLDKKILHADLVGEPGSGVGRRFSADKVREIAVYGALTAAGCQPRFAARFAGVFAKPSEGRGAFHVFPEGSTWMIADKKRGARIINTPRDGFIEELLRDPVGEPTKSTLIVNVNAIVDAVDKSLATERIP